MTIAKECEQCNHCVANDDGEMDCSLRSGASFKDDGSGACKIAKFNDLMYESQLDCDPDCPWLNNETNRCDRRA